MGFKCQYCKKVYVKETTLDKHMCVKKERMKHIKTVRFIYSLKMFNLFMNAQTSMPNKNHTAEDLVNHRYYNDFSKFGEYVAKIRPIYPELFLTFVSSSGATVDKWESKQMYGEYVSYIIYMENPLQAIYRSLTTLTAASERSGVPLIDYVNTVTPIELINLVGNGYISPWFVYLTLYSDDLIRKINDHQCINTARMLDVSFWSEHIQSFPDEQNRAISILDGVGL